MLFLYKRESLLCICIDIGYTLMQHRRVPCLIPCSHIFHAHAFSFTHTQFIHVPMEIRAAQIIAKFITPITIYKQLENILECLQFMRIYVIDKGRVPPIKAFV